MKINPKLTDQVTKVSVDLEKKLNESVKAGKIEDVVAELPRMSLEAVMPKSQISRALKKTVKKGFNVEKAIEEFGIKDKDTIVKICEHLDKDIIAFEEKFSSKKGEIANAAKKHQMAVKKINKRYDKFVKKIETMLESKDSEEAQEAYKLFEEHIAPRIQRLQEAFKKVDTRTDISSSYRLKSIRQDIKNVESLKQAGVVTFAIEQQRGTLTPADFDKANSEMMKKLNELPPEDKKTTTKTEPTSKPKEKRLYTEHEIAGIKRELEEATTFDDMARVVHRIEDLKTSDPQLYEKFEANLKAKIELMDKNGIVPKQNTVPKVDVSSIESSVMKYSKMGVDAIQKEIEKLTVDDLVTDKLGKINDVITHFAKTHFPKYEALSEKFNSKIVELSQGM